MRAARTVWLLLIVWPWSMCIGIAGITAGISRYVALSIVDTWSRNE